MEQQMQRATLSEIKEYVKSQVDSFITERVPYAASLALKTAITFLGTAIGIFLRELVNNPEFQQMVNTRPAEEVNAALRTALQEMWSKTYDLFFTTFKRNIGTGTLEANYFAEQVMHFMQEKEKSEQYTEQPVSTGIGGAPIQTNWINFRLKE